MFTIKKIKAVVLFVALFGGISAFAQVPQQGQQPQQQTTEVKTSELQEFASVYKQLEKTNNEAQEEMTKVIEDEGMTVDRYNKLRATDNNPTAKSDASDSEKKQKESIDKKFEKLAPQFQEKQMNIVKKSKLSVDRYQEIAQAINTDQDLQQKFQKMMMEK